MTKYLLYARRSTDEDDRQVLSIESQLAELHELARKENLEIVEEFVESRTAKEPGRPVFNQMISKTEKELGGYGILAWHPDRLARNSVDGGKIIYLVDTGKIASLKFPTFWFENTPQGKFMLNIAFGQSKYYVDNLSENIRRGIRQKLRRGEMYGLAPLGYINDPKTRKIVKDPQRWQAVRQLFEAYATGEHNLEDLKNLFKSLGLVSKTKGNYLGVSAIEKILQNPTYYGMFLHKGELYQGIHEPIISKQLFDKVQQVIKQRGKPRKVKGLKPFVFRGVFKCGECGYSITADRKIKKSGREYVYYFCTRKSKTVRCRQNHFVREEDLAKQVKEICQKVALKDEWANKMLAQLEKDKKEIAHSHNPLAQDLKKELEAVENKLDRLLTAYLNGALELREYQNKKNELVGKRASLRERLENIGQEGYSWLEPMREWILSSQKAKNLSSLEEKRDFLRKIGSNFILAGGRISFSISKPTHLFFLPKPFPNWWKILNFARTSFENHQKEL